MADISKHLTLSSPTLMSSLILFRMAFFTVDGPKGQPLHKVCHTHPAMMKLGTVIPYLKKVQTK